MDSGIDSGAESQTLDTGWGSFDTGDYQYDTAFEQGWTLEEPKAFGRKTCFKVKDEGESIGEICFDNLGTIQEEQAISQGMSCSAQAQPPSAILAPLFSIATFYWLLTRRPTGLK